jgi:hypothetical protein
MLTIKLFRITCFGIVLKLTYNCFKEVVQSVRITYNEAEVISLNPYNPSCANLIQLTPLGQIQPLTPNENLKITKKNQSILQFFFFLFFF